MEWEVVLHADFAPEVDQLPEDVQLELATQLAFLRRIGFRLGRPSVDTLSGSRHANMKELRVKVLNVPWRFAFAFDPARRAVVLCGGSKAGVSQKLFYRRLIELADRRYDQHLMGLEARNG